MLKYDLRGKDAVVLGNIYIKEMAGVVLQSILMM